MQNGYELGDQALRQINHLIRDNANYEIPQAKETRRQQIFIQKSSGIHVRNDSGEIVPAFGIMRITGSTILTYNNGTTVYTLTIDKPNTTFERIYLVNGPEPIPAASNSYGAGNLCDLPYRALYDTADGTPDVGQWWGAYPSSWKLRRHCYGFYIWGDPKTTTVGGEHVRVSQHMIFDVVGKTSAAHAKDASVAVNVWKGDRSAAIGSTIASVFNPYGAVATTKRCRVSWHAEKPELSAAEC